MATIKRHALKVSLVLFIVFFIILSLKEGFHYAGVSEFIGFCFGIWAVSYLISLFMIFISRLIFKKKKVKV